MTELNIPLLTNIRNWIASDRPMVLPLKGEDIDVHFDMGFVFSEKGSGYCGSVCCIAGAALAMDDGASYALEMTAEDWAEKAAFLLGIKDFDDAERLFIPDSFTHSGLREFDLGEVTNEWAVAVLDNLIATGKIDWSVGAPQSLKR